MEPLVHADRVIIDPTKKSAEQALQYGLKPSEYQALYDLSMSAAILAAVFVIGAFGGFLGCFFWWGAEIESFWSRLLAAAACGLLGAIPGVLSAPILFKGNHSARFTWKAPRKNYEHCLRTGTLVIVPPVLESMWGTACAQAGVGAIPLSHKKLAPYFALLARLCRLANGINDSAVSEETRTRCIKAVETELPKIAQATTRDESLEKELDEDLLALGY